MRLLVLVACVAAAFPCVALAQSQPECPVEMALAETLGPPESDGFTVSVIPYDAHATGGDLRLCYAEAAGRDALGTRFDTPPAGVTCTSPVTSWSAAQRVDFHPTSLSSATRYWYKVQCSDGVHWRDRGVDSLVTLPAAGDPDAFTFTVEADNHFGENYWSRTKVPAYDGQYALGGPPDYEVTLLEGPGDRRASDGLCGTADLGVHGGSVNYAQQDYAFDNLRRAVLAMREAHGSFHVNLGDYYMGSWGSPVLEGQGEWLSCPPNFMLHSPVYGWDPLDAAWPPNLGGGGLSDIYNLLGIGHSPGTVEFGYPIFPYDTMHRVDQSPGFPERNAARPESSADGWCWGGYGSRVNADCGQGTVPTLSSATVYALSRWKVWRAQKFFQPLYASQPMVFAWGNWDLPKWGDPLAVGSDDATTYAARGAPRNTAGDLAQDTFAQAWADTVVNPAGASYYEPTGCTGGCDTRGYYYTFTAGQAQFWVLNPYDDSGGKGTYSSVPFDGSHQFPEHASDWSLGEAQYSWLAATVAASTARWKFVLLHQLPGGIDTRFSNAGYLWGGFFHWYGRGNLQTGRRYCDLNSNGLVDAPTETTDPGARSCTTDDSMPDGYNEDQANTTYPTGSPITWDRPPAWEALYDCAAGIACIPSPYANRTADLDGDATYGAGAMQNLLAANVDADGASFVLLGHDHLSTAGCKYDSDGCTRVHYILTGQPVDASSVDATTPPPATGGNHNSAGGLWDGYFDFNGDGVADYRADGAPYITPVDQDAYSIRKHGSQVRGFQNVSVSPYGVVFDFTSVDVGDFSANGFGDTIYSYRVGAPSLWESDFDGAAGADSEAGRAGSAPTVNLIDCDDVAAPVLEGTQSCHVSTGTGWIGPASYTAAAQACADLLVRPLSDTDAGLPWAFAQLRDAGGVTRAGIQALPTGGALDGQLRIGWPAAGTAYDWAYGYTYQLRLCYDGDTDTATLAVDQCDADDANCDGESDSTPGTTVAVPAWGAGSYIADTVDGAGSGLTVEQIYSLHSASSTIQGKLDALGVCSGDLAGPLPLKCGDGFE